MKVITYGSGVASELVRTYGSDSVRSLAHVGRQSLISAMNGPSQGVELPRSATTTGLERVVQEDLQASLKVRLTQQAESADLLIWDIGDERFGVVATADSTYLTRSPQLKKAALGLPRDSVVLSFGTDEHFTLWQQASTEFVSFLKELGLLEKTVLLDVAWASVDEFGTDITLPYGMSPAQANSRFQPYLRHLESLGVQVLSEHQTVSSANHRIGPAPFNYHDSVYHSLSNLLHQWLVGNGLSNGRPAWNWDTRHNAEIKTWTSPAQADFTPRGRTEHIFRPHRPSSEHFPTRFLVENTGSDVLLVISHGALPRSKYSVPRFEWLATLANRTENRIFLSDTTLEVHNNLELAWFTGSANDDLTSRYAKLVQEAADQLGATKIVFMGGSGGGFASLSLAAKIPGSRALVFNPQTVIRNYWNGSVDEFQKTLFPELQSRSGLGTLGPRVDATLLPHSGDYQIIYVQNDDDALHVDKHLTPFTIKNQIPLQSGVSNDGNISVILERFAQGHNMPYREVLLDFVDIAVSGWGAPLTSWHDLPMSSTTRAYRDQTPLARKADNFGN